MAAVGVLSSCSSGDDTVGVEYSANVSEATQLVPIQLGMNNNALSVSVRGTGTVGDTLDRYGIAPHKNVWQAQMFNVFMLNKDSITLAKNKNDVIFDNTVFFAPGMGDGDNPAYLHNIFKDVPTTNDSTARPMDDVIRYFPLSGNFDFYAYRTDSAEVGIGTGTPDHSLNTGLATDDSLFVDFEIDGSQDIMVAKAIPTKSDSIKLGALESNGSSTKTQVEKDQLMRRAYSAYAARRGVQPNLVFKHLLTRLTFDVVPCTPGTVDKVSYVTVDAIKVITKQTKGRLTIAGKSEQTIKWEDSEKSLELKQRIPYGPGTGEYNVTPGLAGKDLRDSAQLVKLDTVSLQDLVYYEAGRTTVLPTTSGARDSITGVIDDARVHIGEAILVAPEESYEIELHVTQKMDSLYSKGHIPTNTQPISTVLKTTIKPGIRPGGNATSTTFNQGQSYNVTIKLYGIEQIVVNTTLQTWEHNDDDDIVVSPEED